MKPQAGSQEAEALPGYEAPALQTRTSMLPRLCCIWLTAFCTCTLRKSKPLGSSKTRKDRRKGQCVLRRYNKCRLAWLKSVTSADLKCTLSRATPGSSCSSCTAASNLGTERAMSTTLAPRRTRIFAKPSPMPLDPPLTTTSLSLKSRCLGPNNIDPRTAMRMAARVPPAAWSSQDI